MRVQKASTANLAAMTLFCLSTLRAISLVAIIACAAMIVDDVAAAPAFCGFRAGCDEVLHSAYGRPFGIPLSLIGLAAFGVFFGLTLFPQSSGGRFIGGLALAAGVCGLLLVALQVFVLRRTCPLCLIVDAAAILLAAVALVAPAKHSQLWTPRRAPWVSAAVAAVVLPPLWVFLKPMPDVPAQVRALWRADAINVVEITDMACPYCRQTHAAIEPFRERHAAEIHFARVVAPLPQHKRSRAAAKTYLFAKQQGQGDAILHQMFASENHSAAALRRLVVDAGLDTDEHERAQTDPALDAELDATLHWVLNTPGGLPQIWVDRILLVGVQTEESLSAALSRAKRLRNNTSGH